MVGADLDSSIALRLGRAYADHLTPGGGGRFLVGHDARVSSPSRAEARLAQVLDAVGEE